MLPRVSLVVEAPYSITLSNGAEEVDNTKVDAKPSGLAASSGLFRVSAGVSLHF